MTKDRTTAGMHVQQYDVVRTTDGPLAVVLQSDLIDTVSTRVIAPLYDPQELDPPMRYLNPEFTLTGARYVLAVQFVATLDVREFQEIVGSVARDRDRITRAIDTLLVGV